MPLPTPVLDSRTWDELTTEARALIPQAAPGWTDHNLHDPGITFVELFAWLTEMQLFALDHAPPAALRAYLRLIGIVPRPAGVARTVVAVRLPAGAPAPLDVGPGLPLLNDSGAALFESRSRVGASPAWLELGPAETTSRGVLVREVAGVLRDLGRANQDRDHTFLPFGDGPAIGDALRLGFEELPAGPGVVVSLFAWAPDGGGAGAARTRWEYLDGEWRSLEVVADHTRALTRSGSVRLRGPASHQRDAASGRYWIRCRVEQAGYDCPPELAALAVNPLVAVHGQTVAAPQELGESTGAAAHRLFLDRAPVVAGSTRLTVTDADGTASWREVGEWDAAGPADHVYRLEPETGAVTFGDGRSGCVPAAGATLTMERYRVGGGPVGNVPAGTLADLAGDIDTVQPFAAAGGSEREPLRRAQGRALDSLAAQTRGVTAADFAALARGTPGVPVGRAEALPGYHPRFGCMPAAGVVTVVVLPRCGRPPQPSPEFLAAVRRHVARRRLLATELHVVGPRYLGVRVSATLHVTRGTSGASQTARSALAAFFDPLTGGEDGGGWPLGRDVYESEVLALLSGLPGVRYVDGLTIAGAAGAASCSNLALCPTELVRSLDHTIAVEEVAP